MARSETTRLFALVGTEHYPTDALRACLSPMSFWAPDRITSQSAWLEHAPFAFWLIEALRPRMLVELGTQGGFSYFTCCEAVQRLRLATRCHAVDTWKGDEHAGFYGEDVFAAVKSHNDRRYAAFSALVRSTFDEALQHFSDGTIDLLHIDGRHFYEDVKHDFESWRPRLSPRAIVLFHDTNERERGFGVFRLWEELCGSYPHFEFPHGHGLGVLGVGAELTPKIRALFAAADDSEASSYLREAYSRLGELARLRGEADGLRQRIAAADAAAAQAASTREELTSLAAERAALEQQLAARSADVVRLSEAAALALGRASELEQKLAGESAAIARLTDELAVARGQAGDLVSTLARVSAELARSQGDLARARDDLAASRDGLGATRSALAAARDNLAAEQTRTVDLKSELAARAAEATRLSGERARSARRAARLVNALEARELDVQSLWASTSWRLTHPVRLLGRRMPRLAKLGRRVLDPFLPAAPPRLARATLFADWQQGGAGDEYERENLPPLGRDMMLASADHAHDDNEVDQGLPSADLHGRFDEAFYLDIYPDVAAAVARGEVASAWEHYCRNGRPENRLPRASPPYPQWARAFHTLSSSDVELIRVDIERFKRHPKISVVLIARAATRDALKRTLKSLSQQIYRDFEIILAGQNVKAVWQPPEEPGIELRRVRSERTAAADFNAGLEAATGELLFAVEAGDELAPHALYLAARHAVDDPHLQVIYGDEDELTPEGNWANPFFKPGWNPELILAFNYVGKAVFFHTDLIRSIGGARATTGEAWRWDLILRSSERTAAPARRIPLVLYHEAALEDRRRREVGAGVSAIAEAIAQRNQSATAIPNPRGWFSIKRRLPNPAPHVTIIVPTRDRCDLLRRCIDGVLERTAYPSFDVMIIDNGSRERETIKYLRSLRRDQRVSIVRDNDEFNFATMHNRIVGSVRGEVVVLLNNDIDVIGTDWLETMVGHTLDPQVGAVGAKLYFPDGKVQHAGVVIGLGGAAGHLFHQRDRVDVGPAALLMASQDVSAVTGSCMAFRRSVFAELRGFDEAFAIDYNDIDFCLRVQQHGYRVVWAAAAELYHLEAATRGRGHVSQDPAQKAKRERFQRETARFKEKWKHLLDHDPLYNPNLSLTLANRSLSVPPRVVRPWQLQERRSEEASTKPSNDVVGVDRVQPTGLKSSAKLLWWCLTAQLGPRLHELWRRRQNIGLIMSSALFDEAWYRWQNPDVQGSSHDLAAHYLLFGGMEGRDPSPLFHSNWYLQQNSDVRAAGVNPLVHYLRNGVGEGREPRRLTSDAPDPEIRCSDTWASIEASPEGAGIRTIAVSHNLNHDGAPNSQLELIIGLHHRGIVDAIVLSPHDGPLRSAYQKARVPALVISPPDLSSATAFEESAIAMACAFRESGAEVVYANTLQTFWAIAVAERAGLPAIWNVRESESWQSYFDFLAPEIRPAAYRAFAYAHRVVFVADATRRAWEPVRSRENFVTIHNGLDADRLRLRTYRDRDSARTSLDIGQAEVAIVILGTVCERKGQLDLVRAFKLLPNELVSRARVFIVGDRLSVYSREVREEAQALPHDRAARLVIVPETDEPYDYFKAADVAVCCSYIESYPRVTLEAMAFNLPLITTPVFGIAEQVQSGVNALFYDPGDVAQLTAHIGRLITDSDLRLQLASNSRRVLEALPTYKDMLDAYAGLLSEVRAERECVRPVSAQA